MSEEEEKTAEEEKGEEKEKEEKEEKKEEKEELEDFVVVEERVYTVPLVKARVGRGYRRAKRAVKVLRDFISKHMKSDDVKIMAEVNEEIWKNGIRNPPRRIRVKALRNEENQVRVYLAQ